MARAEAAEFELLRIEVGESRGLAPRYARRLTGSTRAELEADADAFVAAFEEPVQ